MSNAPPAAAGGGQGVPPGRSAPAAAARSSPAPLLAPTGSPGVNAVEDVVNAVTAPFATAPPAAHAASGTVARDVGFVVAAVGAPAKIIDTAFAELTAPLAAMFPAMPAVTLLGMHVGPPHAHTHPPSLIPPAPPVPLPSIGMLLGSGAVTVTIGGLPAARVGDIGIAVTCGSLAPPFEVFMGSSSVFIGGARAARVMDITKHCNPSAVDAFSVALGAAGAVAGAASALATSNPWAAAQAAADAATLAMKMLMGKDPGIPPGMGMLVGPPVPNVLIGGFPCPALGQMAVGGLLKALKAFAKSLKGGSPESNGVCGNAGEPVYVVTGENFTKAADFVASLFEWRRHYTTARFRSDGPLGHGWRHFYQRSLRVRLHRATFFDWNGTQVTFPCFEYGGDVTRAEGRVLRRLTRGRYRLTYRAEPEMEFVGNEFEGDLRLSKLVSRHHELVLEYDALGRLSVAVERELRGAQLRRFELEYDESGHLKRLDEIPAAGLGKRAEPLLRAAYAYTQAADLRLVHDALGGRSIYEYDSFHRLTRNTDARNYTFTYRYDALGRCVETSGQDGLWTTKIEYFPEERFSRVTESQGGTWDVHYDGDGVVTKIVDPYGGVKVRERDGEGKLSHEVDSGGRVTRWLYDRQGAHQGRIDRFGNVFPPEAEMPAPPNPFARKVPSTALGRLFEGGGDPAEAALGAETSLLHSLPPELEPSARLCFAFRERDGHRPIDLAPKVERDSLGRKIRETDALGRVREWKYDATGNVVEERDRDGRIVAQRTTSWNLVGERRDPLGHATQYQYSALEQIVGVVDPLGNATRYEYDLKERLVRVHRGARLRDEYVYDRGDHFVEKRDGAGTIVFKNEIHGNHFVKVRHLASGGLHKFDYDARGRITEASTDEHDVKIGYDVWGRRSRDLRDGRGVEHDFLHGEADDTARSKVFGRFESRIDLRPRAASLTNAAGRTARVSFRQDGVVTRSCSNGTTEILQYDLDGRLRGRLAYRAGADGRLARWVATYGYTAEGDLVLCDDSHRGRTQFDVDAAHRLIGEETAGGRVAYWQDAANNVRFGWLEIGDGNRLVRSAAERFAYDERDRLLERRGNDGSIVRYSYDSFDMLARIDWVRADGGPPATWAATYDAIGRRVETRWADAKREFYWDGDRLAAEVFPSGRLRIYEYATREALVPLGFVEYANRDAAPDSGETFHVFSDPSGMPLHIEDESGAAVWWAERVHPFGAVSVRNGATLEYNLRWPGHYFDPETGLHCNRYRYYDPGLARYLQSDPTGYAGSPVNLYAYCPNPLVHVDVLGLHEDLPQRPSTEEGAGEPDGKEGPPNLSREELAAQEGTTPEHIDARHEVAAAFYEKYGRTFDRALGATRPLTTEEANSQLNAIDFDHPVLAGPPPPCPSQLAQWQVPGQSRGGFFAAHGTPVENVGAGRLGKAWTLPGQPVVEKQPTGYTLDPNTRYLQSTAGPIDDTWSVPGTPQPTPGGAPQLYVPDGYDSSSPTIARAD